MTLSEILLFISFCSLSAIMAYQDVRTYKVSRFFSVLLLILMLTARILTSTGTAAMADILFSTAVAFIAFFITRLLCSYMNGADRTLGLADVFYSTSMGAFLGIEAWFIACALACFGALCVSLFRVICVNMQSARLNRPEPEAALARIQSRAKPVPFIACLFAGSVIARLVTAFR